MTVKLAALQMTSGPCPEENFDEVERLLSDSELPLGSIVVLPECFSCFGASDSVRLSFQETEQGAEQTARLLQIANKYGCHLFAGTMPMSASSDTNESKKCFAACRYIDGASRSATKQKAIYNKIHLFDVEVADNTKSYAESLTTLPGSEVVVVKTAGLRVGIAVCYDIRFAGLFDAMGDIDVLVLPAAFIAATGEAHWHALLRARAIEKQCYVVAANQTGVHANGRQTYGHSMIVSPWGEVLAQRSQHSGIVSADVDIQQLENIRRTMPVTKHTKFRSQLVK